MNKQPLNVTQNLGMGPWQSDDAVKASRTNSAIKQVSKQCHIGKKDFEHQA
jgi:hypothetical protein